MSGALASQMWNFSLGGGLIPGLCSIALGGVAFTLLLLCIGELASTIPFSGGTYGFVRVALGRQMGFIAGIMELVE